MSRELGLAAGLAVLMSSSGFLHFPAAPSSGHQFANGNMMFENLHSGLNPTCKISISEKQLEDFFIATAHENLGLRPVARQATLDCGRLDVLCYYGDRKFYVVELKIRPLADQDIAQVLAYTCELKARHPQFSFIPYLIGPSLSGTYLRHILQHRGEDRHIGGTGVAEYTLFSFSPRNGLSFRYYDRSQSKLEENREELLGRADFRFTETKRMRHKRFVSDASAPYGVLNGV